MSERPLLVASAWRWWLGFFAVVAFGAYMTVRAYLEGLPEVFRTVRYFDKVAHFVIAGLLAFFLDGAIGRRRLFAWGGIAVPLAAALLLVPLGIEEFLQRFATFRTSSYGDFAADVAGVIVLIPISRRVAK